MVILRLKLTQLRKGNMHSPVLQLAYSQSPWIRQAHLRIDHAWTITKSAVTKIICILHICVASSSGYGVAAYGLLCRKLLIVALANRPTAPAAPSGKSCIVCWPCDACPNAQEGRK